MRVNNGAAMIIVRNERWLIDQHLWKECIVFDLKKDSSVADSSRHIE